MRPEDALPLDLMRRMAGGFNKFIDEWYDQIDHHRDDLLRKAKGEPILEEYFGGPDGAGQLGEDLDLISGQALSRYRELAPRVTPKEEALFCYMAMRMAIATTKRLLTYSRQRLTMQTRMMSPLPISVHVAVSIHRYKTHASRQSRSIQIRARQHLMFTLL